MRFKMRPIYAGAVALAALLAACNPAETVRVTGVAIAGTLELRVGVKDTETLAAVIEPENATNRSVTWSSDNEAVATVDAATGLVRAVDEGTATVTATTAEGGYTADCTVTVTWEKVPGRVDGNATFADLDQAAKNDLYKQKKSEKRGTATNFLITNMPDLLGPGVSWCYDWGGDYRADRWEKLRRNGMVYAPMGWSGNPTVSSLEQNRSEGAEYVLGYNEPNLRDQANMSPSYAANLWRGFVSNAKAAGMKIISPAMCYGNTTNYSDPVVWLDEFLAKDGVSLDDIDGIAGHTYMPNTSGVKAFARKFAKYGKPFWLTEFCHANGTISTDRSQHLSFMSEIITWLEADPAVGKYSWFMDSGYGDKGGNCELIDRSDPSKPLDRYNPQAGVLNELGVLYISASSLDKTTCYNVGENIPAEHYSDSSATESASSAEGWKSSVVPYPTTDGAGTLEIHFGTGCWVEYRVDVPEDGTYRLDVRYTSERPLKMTLTTKKIEDQSVEFEPTGAIDAWKTSGAKVYMAKGIQTIRLSYSSGMARINWLRITSPNN